MTASTFKHRRSHALPLLALLLLFASAVAWADPQPRNDTGQSACFHRDGQEIDCTDQEFPGQDGRIGRDRAANAGDLPKTGAGAAGFDFTKIANNGSELPPTAALGAGPTDWACTRDNRTGFIWEVKTRDGGPRDLNWAFAWYYPHEGNGGVPGDEFDVQLMCGFTLECNTQAYLNHVNALQLCGIGDWRMPSRDELITIVNYGSRTDLALDENYFSTSFSVWTIDTATEHGDGDQALTVIMADGHVEPAPKGSGHSSPLLVHGEPFRSNGEPPTCGKRENPEIFPSTAGAFDFDGQGLVRDNRTELVWDRCSIGQKASGDGPKGGCEGEAQPMSWSEALERVNQLNAEQYRGHDDWRMPNIKELQSIVERRCGMPIVDARVFPNQNPEPMWSSTSYLWQGQTQHAWVLQMEMGHMAALPKDNHMRLRVVRGGAEHDDYQGASAYRVGGTLSGMVGTGLRLRMEVAGVGEDSLIVNANGSFSFALGLPDGASYQVTRVQGPVPAQTCAIANGSGNVGGAHVNNIQVTCEAPAPAIIEATPASLSFTAAANSSTSDTLSIANRGGGILNWSIDTAHAAGRAIPAGAAVDCSAVGDLIVHDDGMHETGYGGQPNWRNGLVFVERFVPTSYPASIRALCLPLTAQGATSAQFEIVAFRDNGPNGGPGTELGSIPASANGIPTYPVATPQWFAFDLGALYTTIDSGGLYLGMRGLPTTTNVYLLTDESTDRPVGYGEGYWFRNGTWQRMADMPSMPNYRATLMRAAPGAPQPLPVGCDDPHAVPWLSLDRYAGQTNAGTASPVAVRINTAGMLTGEYRALLCIQSDATVGLMQVPISLSVMATHTVTPSAGAHGSISPATAQSVIHGQTTRFTLAAEAGWRVASVGGTCGGELVGVEFTTAPVTADCTVVANFEVVPIVTHVVTPSAGAHGSISPATAQSVIHGQTTRFTLAAEAGWHVASVGGTCGGQLVGVEFTTAPVIADCTVTAQFEADPVTHVVTPSAGAHGWISPATAQSVIHGQTTHFRLAAEAGWRVASVGGTCGGELVGIEFTTAPITADCTVQANFESDGDLIFSNGFD